MDKKKFISVLALIMAGVMILTLAMSLITTLVNAASSSEIRDQIADLEEEKSIVDAELKELEGKLQENLVGMMAIIAQKDAIDQQISLLHTQITTVTQLVSAYNLLIADQQEELDRAEARLEELNARYSQRIRVMEEKGSLSYWSVIFNASSFSDLLDRLNMVAEIANADAKRLAELKAAAEEVEAARADLLERKQEMEETKRYLQDAQETLAEKRSEADLLLAELAAIGREYEDYIEEAENKQHALMDELAKADEALDEALLKEWLATSVPPTTNSSTVSDRVTNTVDGITWYTPTKNYYISSEFGWRWHPISGEWKHHNGIDMAAAQGTPIYATRAGIVTVAAFQEGGAGWYVKINHGDGYGSIYMHMTHYIVSAGEYVTAGQIIGYVGSTGGSTGPHLHFGISYNGEYKDPRKYIKI